MSDNSNDPKNPVTIAELKTNMTISFNKVDKKAYVFIGQTPKAQLTIEINDFDKDYETIEEMFPAANIIWS